MLKRREVKKKIIHISKDYKKCESIIKNLSMVSSANAFLQIII